MSDHHRTTHTLAAVYVAKACLDNPGAMTVVVAPDWQAARCLQTSVLQMGDLFGLYVGRTRATPGNMSTDWANGSRTVFGSGHHPQDYIGLRMDALWIHAPSAEVRDYLPRHCRGKVFVSEEEGSWASE